jgi:hypothetical protein
MRPTLKIVSGGQTGADRAALDWAIAKAIPHGGFCPQGRLAEDGVIADRYHLIETATSDYAERTEKNVIFSHGTVIFSVSEILEGGSKLTADLAQQYQKPFLHIHQATRTCGQRLAEFIRQHQITRLNVAGSRASREPKVSGLVTATLDDMWACLLARQNG